MHVIARRSLRLAGILASVFSFIPAQARALNVDLLMTDSGQKAGNQFGISVATAGDFNGDGYDDVIVGANAYAQSTGRAYVYFGGPGSDNTPDVILNGEMTYGGFGQSVGAAGDVNGDGYDDIVVGAPVADFPSNEGASYVFFGGASPDSIFDLRFIGHAASERLGISVGTAGDVNNDGYSDIIVGAYGALSNTGRAYLYFGGASPDTIPDVTFVGAHTNDRFGTAVSTAGDVDGDGYADVIIGTRALTGSSDDRGLAYLYYGGAAMDSIPEFTLHGEASDDFFGSDVAGGGDANGDGYDDILVGAEGNDAGGAEAGRAYLFLGGPGVDTTADVVVTGLTAGDALGHSVGFAGDLNLDGTDDFLIGAPEKDEGTVYFFHGGSVVNSTADTVLLGEALGDNFGQDVGSAGDFDGDGTTDIIVGASLAGAGKAYVYDIYTYHVLYPNGSETWVTGTSDSVVWKGSISADLEISYDAGGSWSTLATGIGGNPLNSYPLTVPVTTTELALVRLTFSGSPPGPETSDTSDWYFRIVDPYTPPGSVCGFLLGMHTQNTGDDRFGHALSTAGDFNGDGYDDFIVGAFLDDAGAYHAGRAYLYFGGDIPDTVHDLAFTGMTADDLLGYSVGGGGDFNGDGYDDVVVGAYGNDAGGDLAGRAYVYFGGNPADSVADLTFTGSVSGGDLGFSSGMAGDVNGDGYDDFIVGASGASAPGGLAGAAYVYFGGNPADTTADLTLLGEAPGDYFGFSVATAGDFNGDGYSDLVVGATGAGDRGRVYLYYGGATPDSVPDLVLTGVGPPAFSEGFGISAGTAGDVNGDGYDDIVVGAPFNDTGYDDAGRVYVFYGGPTADDIPDLVFTGSSLFAWLGRSVATAGDVNNDGYSDILVGAPDSNGEVSNAGQVFIYHGGPGADDVPDQVWTGTEMGEQLGWKVASAGDLTGDGINDVLFGRGGLEGAFASVCGQQPVGIEASRVSPPPFTCSPLFPNPVRAGKTIQIAFSLPTGGIVVAALFDVQGRRVAATTPYRIAEGGDHSLSWNPGPVSAGVYFLELRTSTGLRARRSLCILR